MTALNKKPTVKKVYKDDTMMHNTKIGKLGVCVISKNDVIKGQIVRVTKDNVNQVHVYADFAVQDLEYLDKDGIKQTVKTIAHNCGAKIPPFDKAYGCKICYSNIFKCKYTDKLSSTEVDLEYAYEHGWDQCQASGKIGTCKNVLVEGVLLKILESDKNINKCICDKLVYKKDHCGECFNKLFFRCIACGHAANRTDANDKSFQKCNNCMPKVLRSSPGWLNTDRYYGIEFELNIATVDDSKKIWKRVRDGSVNNGWEYQSPIFSGCEWLEQEVKRFCYGAQKLGAKSGTDCGLHVHIDASDFTATEIETMYRNAIAIEDWHYSVLPSYRKTGTFSKPIVKLQEKHGIFDKKVLPDYWNKSNVKYCWINFLALKEHGTVEFRGHEGTTDYLAVQRWVEVLMAFTEFCKKNRLIDAGKNAVYSMFEEMKVRPETIQYFKDKAELQL